MADATRTRLADLEAKTRPPASAAILTQWVQQADSRTGAGGRLSWLIGSTVVIAALQRAVDGTGTPRFLLKGGTLLQHRLGHTSRATKDIDGLVRGDIDEFVDTLDEVLAEPWGPLTLRRERLEVIATPARVVKPRRFDVVLELRGKVWRRIQVEIAPDEGGAGEFGEPVPAPALAAVGLPAPDHLVGLAMRFQIAQKIHACTDPHEPPGSINDRARDVVDLLLLRELGVVPLHEVHDAVTAIFHARADDARALQRPPRSWPTRAVAHPHWRSDFAVAARAVDMDLELEQAVDRLNDWLQQIEDAAVSAVGRA